MSRVLVLYSKNDKYRVSMCPGSLGQVIEHRFLGKSIFFDLPNDNLRILYFRRSINFKFDEVIVNDLFDPGKLKGSTVWFHDSSIPDPHYKKLPIDCAWFSDPYPEEKLKMIKAKFLK